MADGSNPEEPKRGSDAAVGCLVVLLIMIAGGVIGYLIGSRYAENNTSGGLDALPPLYIGAIGGVIAGAVIGALLTFGRRS